MNTPDYRMDDNAEDIEAQYEAYMESIKYVGTSDVKEGD